MTSHVEPFHLTRVTVLDYYPQIRVFKRGRTSAQGEALDAQSQYQQSPAVIALKQFVSIAKVIRRDIRICGL